MVFLFYGVLLLISYVDLKKKIIPDSLLLLGVLILLIRGEELSGMLLILSFTILYALFDLSKERLGFGDVKLMLLMISYWKEFLLLELLFLSSVLMCLCMVPLLYKKRISVTTEIPFAPFIVLSFILIDSIHPV